MSQLEFLAIAKPKRENWLATMTPEEKMVMGEHLEYVRRMFSEGKVVLSGPCLDGTYGIIIYKADSPESAQKMYENDPAVKAGIMDTELHPYKVGVMEGR
ncbi:YCII-related domain-containing protein [Paenibacillus sp. yr247]|uniref:YciI family protein n=1 Tax=Paenibacillus sp. yr247 TaxID=1761880 RepID=UPI0008812A38|nr:YciI family protein [Paenibacillus sp. yr247]SDM78256.1 YCII-related domain-containing protein [Paenibacillus sp. yr247]